MAFDPSSATEFNPSTATEVADAPASFDASTAKEFDPTSAKPVESKGFVSELKKSLGEMSMEDWKKKSMIAPIAEYTARSALGGIMPGLEPVTPAEQKQVQRSASDTFNAIKEGVQNPVETAKAIGKAATDNPGAFVGDLIKGLVYDPEMLATGSLGRMAQLTKDASTVAKAGRVAYNTANTATQFGVLAAGAEGASAKLEGRDVNPQDLMKAASESVYTAVAFEAMHGVLDKTGKSFRDGKPEAQPLEIPKAPAPEGKVTVEGAPAEFKPETAKPIEEVKPTEIAPGMEAKPVEVAPIEEAKPSKQPKVEIETLTEPVPEQSKAIVDKSLQENAKLEKEVADYAKQAGEAVRKRITNIQAEERFIHNDTVKLVKEIPDVAARERISEALDRGDMSALSPKEKVAAEELKTKFKDVGAKAQKLGIIKELRDNYITHIVDWEKSGIKNIQDAINAFVESGGGGREGLSGKSRFGKERKYETFEDLNKALQDSGMVLKTKDAAEIYQQYARSMNRAIENKAMINELKGLTDVEGYPLMKRITEKEPMPRGWETINAPQMQGYAVHPEIAPALKFVFENSEPSKVMKALNALSQTTKRLQVMASLFHFKSLVEANLLSGFGNFAKEIISGFKGTRDALELFKKGGLGDEADFLIRNGLKVEMPEDVSRGILSEIGRGGDIIISKLGPDTGKTLEKSAATVEKYTLGLADKVTWDFAHTGFKLQVAMKELEKAKKNFPDVPPEQLAREITSYVNNTFGGLNWFDVAQRANTKIGKELAMWAFNNQNRRALQLVLFAPDWTASTLRALSTAFGKGTGLKGLVKPRTEADFARRYQLRAALVYGTILNGLNNITAGRDIWDNKDPTRIEFRDGSSMQLAKHSMEPIHWIKDPAKTLTNKLGFIPQITAPLVLGKEYLQPGAPDLLDQSVTGKLAAVGKKALPFQIQSAMGAPTGEGVKRAIAGTLGFPIYGGSASQKAEQRVERKKAEMEKRRKFLKEEAERAKKTRKE